MERTPRTACPGCGGDRRTPEEVGVRDAKYGIPGLWSFVRCADCRLVRLAETLTDPAEGYPREYSQHRGPRELTFEHRWSPARDVRSALLASLGYERATRAVLPRPLTRLALAVPNIRMRAAAGHLLMPPARPSGALLDVGCGNGRLLAVMRLLGWRVAGIEPDSESAAIARQTTGARIDRARDDELYPSGSFDVVTMNHVLEHVEDPGVLLGRCFRVVRPGALIGIVVPNWRSLGHRLFKRDWYALEPPRHVVMYEPSTLERMLERAGFRVVRMWTTSVREWAVAWRTSWRFRTGAASPRPLLAAWGGLSLLASAADDTGEELVAWARRP